MYPTKTSCFDSLDNMEAAYVHVKCLSFIYTHVWICLLFIVYLVFVYLVTWQLHRCRQLCKLNMGFVAS